jgi:hypothetical protein
MFVLLGCKQRFREPLTIESASNPSVESKAHGESNGPDTVRPFSYRNTDLQPTWAGRQVSNLDRWRDPSIRPGRGTKHELFYGTANGQIMVAPFMVEGD